MTTILVVDDDAVDREAAERHLGELEDSKIFQAADGNAALDVLLRHKVDLILTDLRMPGMDGLELVGRVKQDYPLIPVVLMTSRGNEQVAVHALEAGAASYVPKSDLEANLVETVDQVLEVAQTRRSKLEVLKYFDGRETRFMLANELKLIPALAGYLQEGLERLGVGDESVRTTIGVALVEALSNAIIHGNLEVSSELRDHDIKDYYALIQRRSKEKPFSDRRVHFIARESRGRVDYVVQDEGRGFDHTSLPDPTSPDNVVRVRGRGLLLIRTFMDHIEHNEKGNRITLSKTCGVEEG